MKHPLLLLVFTTALTACDPNAVTAPGQPAPAAGGTAAAPAVAVAVPPLTATGPAVTIPADADQTVQWAASVVRVDPLKKQGDYTIKLFGTAGGDPAMNGLYTYIAFFVSPADGWSVFKLGDVLDYRILSEVPGRVDLEVDESIMDPATNAISSRKRRLIVAWAEPADGGAPLSVTATPAR